MAAVRVESAGDGAEFLELLRLEFHARRADRIGLVYADLRFGCECPEPLVEVVMDDAQSHLRRTVPECSSVYTVGGQVRMLARGTILDLVEYADRARLCLDRLRWMEGAASFQVEVALSVAAPGEGPKDLVRRTEALLPSPATGP
ncbi:hypothetical protein ACO0LV_06005 [Pseudactinotalea sp. Z1739]|uniref:hypothetical protein n=1 Tax=Pseudactinotalea sp. Z1739 TaxID=3413028 RepID=UPI003C7C910E